MAEHKVPQDVEADDKLLGPLSFREFIYAMIALAAAALAYFLATMVAIPLVVIPLPVFVVFGVLAVPRKGQPMEIYIGAKLHFLLQPTRRIWDPDGQENLVEITNPSIDTAPQVKDISGNEAAQRLSFLADIEDTQGWSTRGNVNLVDDFASAANTATDVFDDTSLNRVFSDRLAQSEQQVRDEAIARMNTAIATPPPVEQSSFAPPTYTPPAAPAIVTPPPVTPEVPVADEAALSAMLKQSSAANSMTAFQQTVVQPLGASPVIDNPTLTTTAAPVTADPVAPTPAPAPTPTPIPDPTPVPPPIPEPRPEPEHIPELAPIAPPAPRPEPEEPASIPKTVTPKSATIDDSNNTASISAEEVISHDSGASNDNQGGEISLH